MLDGAGGGSVQTYPTPSNMLVKHYPTLFGDVGQCLTSVGWCWRRVCSNVSNTIEHVAMKWRETDCVVFLIAQVKCWKMLDEKV